MHLGLDLAYIMYLLGTLKGMIIMAKSFKATIKDRCNKITTDINKVNDYIHVTAMMIINHAKPKELGGHGDCEAALWLARAMPASMRRKSLIDWFAKYSPIVIKLSDNGDDVGFNAKYKKLSPEDKMLAWNIEGANAETFYEIARITPEDKTYSFEDFMKMVERLSGQIEKKVSEGHVPEADIESAKAIARAVRGLKVERVKPTPANSDEQDERVVEAA